MQRCGNQYAIFDATTRKWRWFASLTEAIEAEARVMTEKTERRIAAGKRVILAMPRKERKP